MNDTLIEEPPELSPLQELLQWISAASQGNTGEDVLNTLAVIKNIRTGAILTIPPLYQPEIAERLREFDIKARQYPFGDKSNFIIVSTSSPALVEKLNALDSLLATNMPEFHKTTGRILGYYTPGDIFSQEFRNAHTKGIAVKVKVKIGCQTKNIEIAPQKVNNPNTYSTALNNVVESFRAIDPSELPPGYSITSVEKIVRGGARKSRKARKTRKSRCM